MANVILIALLFLLAGCSRTRRVVVEVTPPPSVNTRVDSSLIRTPRLEPLPRAGMAESLPLAVRTYRDSLIAASMDVLEVELTGQTATIRTPRGETVHQLPSPGEVKRIRPDTSGAVREYVEGRPDPKRTTFEMTEEETALDKWITLVRWIGALVGLLLLAWAARIAVRMVRS